MKLRDRVGSCLDCAVHYQTIDVCFCDQLTEDEILEIERRGFSIRPQIAFTGPQSWVIKCLRE